MNETRLKGNFTGGHLIYGYTKENHKLLINEEQAEVVRYIYKQYSIGTYVKDIIATLTKITSTITESLLQEIQSITYLKTKSILEYIDTMKKLLKICIQQSYQQKSTIK